MNPNSSYSKSITRPGTVFCLDHLQRVRVHGCPDHRRLTRAPASASRPDRARGAGDAFSCGEETSSQACCWACTTCVTALISARCVNACGSCPGAGPRRLELLGVEPERRGVGEQALAHVLRLALLADLRQRRHQPERADQEGPLLAVQSVVGLLRSVAQHQAVLGQLVADRPHGRAHAFVLGREEADERHQQVGGVERVCVVVLAEDAALSTPRSRMSARISSATPASVRRARARRGVRRVARRGPSRPSTSTSRRRSGAARRAPPRSPDRAAANAPPRLHLVDQHRPQPLGNVVALLGVEVERVEHRAEHVVLALVVGAVADRAPGAPLVALEVIERLSVSSF